MSTIRIVNIIFGVMSVAQISQCAFKGQECLDTHNILRSKHANTKPLKYSKELEKEAQEYADLLAKYDADANPGPTRDLPKRRRRNVPTTKPFFHKELWDGEILFPNSKWDLNKGREAPVGESIHKFCCYSFPYCPSVFFYGLNFPPSAKGVVGHWYKEMKDYDFSKGGRKSEAYVVRHFTNIVWRKTTEIGCGQSRRSKKGCIYTVTRYRIKGSIGDQENYRNNVGTTNTGERTGHRAGGSSFLVVFLVVIIIVFFLVGVLVLAYIKRAKLKAAYAEWQIKRGAKKAEASLRDSYDDGRFKGKKSIIYKPSSKRTRPSIHVVTDVPPSNACPTAPLKPRDPIPPYQNIAVLYKPDGNAVCIIDKSSEDKKALPPRPTSPVKADSPVLRPVCSPPPPPSSTTTTTQNNQENRDENDAFYVNIRDEQGNSKNAPPHKPLPPKTNDGVANHKPCELTIEPTDSNQDALKPPVPAPRPPKSPSSNGFPKPAPRPAKPPAATQNQFQTRTITPGRASKKNPNFRTLPLNDRGSLRRQEKPKDGSTVGPTFGPARNRTDAPEKVEVTNRTNVDFSVAKKAPLAPPKKPKAAASGIEKKPLLPKHLEPGKEERPSSVAEMRKLLEQKNHR